MTQVWFAWALQYQSSSNYTGSGFTIHSEFLFYNSDRAHRYRGCKEIRPSHNRQIQHIQYPGYRCFCLTLSSHTPSSAHVVSFKMCHLTLNYTKVDIVPTLYDSLGPVCEQRHLGPIQSAGKLGFGSVQNQYTISVVKCINAGKENQNLKIHFTIELTQKMCRQLAWIKIGAYRLCDAHIKNMANVFLV